MEQNQDTTSPTYIGLGDDIPRRELTAEELEKQQPTDGELIALGRSYRAMQLSERKLREDRQAFALLISDLTRLYYIWEGNQFTKGQPFTVTLNGEQVKRLTEGASQHIYGVPNAGPVNTFRDHLR